jgi:hypothetical protein
MVTNKEKPKPKSNQTLTHKKLKKNGGTSPSELNQPLLQRSPSPVHYKPPSRVTYTLPLQASTLNRKLNTKLLQLETPSHQSTRGYTRSEARSNAQSPVQTPSQTRLQTPSQRRAQRYYPTHTPSPIDIEYMKNLIIELEKLIRFTPNIAGLSTFKRQLSSILTIYNTIVENYQKVGIIGDTILQIKVLSSLKNIIIRDAIYLGLPIIYMFKPKSIISPFREQKKLLLII